MGLVITFSDGNSVYAGMGGFGQQLLRYILSHMRGLFNTCRDSFRVLPGIGWVWSAQVDMHIMYFLAWDVFGQHEVRYILCASWQRMGLVNTS
jgi:hypothetical protein